MTSLEKWREVTSGLMSPQSIIDFSWYSAVGMFLNRKVWMGDFSRPLFTNTFIVIVGPAGIGKTLSIMDLKKLALSIEDPEKPVVRHVNGITEKPRMVRICANSTNFSAIIEDMCRSTKSSQQLFIKGKRFPYFFTPFHFVEDELSAILREKEGGAIVKALLKFYDSETYEYATRSHQIEKVHNPCVCLLAGTTPSFLQEAHDMGMFADGFSSRTIWLFEGKGRFEAPKPLPLTIEQEKIREQLKLRLIQISKIFGQVTESESTTAFVNDYFFTKIAPAKEESAGFARDYFARKMTHVYKLAMAVHFSDHDDLILTTEDYQKAIGLVEEVEPKMMLGLSTLGKNPLANMSNSVYSYISSKRLKGASFAELLATFLSQMAKKDLLEILDVLKALDRIYFSTDMYKAK